MAGSRAGSLEQALSLAGRLLASAEPAGRMGRVVQTLALRSLVRWAMGDALPARDDLCRALALAEPEGYVRLFVDEGEPMRRLLDDCRLSLASQPPTADSQRLIAYVEKLLASYPSLAAVVESSIVNPQSSIQNPQSKIENPIEPLTERELEVLRLVAGGLTYAEVARRLVVSLNTVRYHVKSVYGKLGVNRRVDAVERARELGLI